MTLEDGHIGGLKNPPAKTIEIKKGKPLIPGIGIQGNSSLSAGSVTADVLAGELVQRMFLPENRCSGYSCRRTGTADVFYRETVRLINHKPPPGWRDKFIIRQGEQFGKDKKETISLHFSKPGQKQQNGAPRCHLAV